MVDKNGKGVLGIQEQESPSNIKGFCQKVLDLELMCPLFEIPILGPLEEKQQVDRAQVDLGHKWKWIRKSNSP